jgi:hypothetical protein
MNRFLIAAFLVGETLFGVGYLVGKLTGLSGAALVLATMTLVFCLQRLFDAVNPTIFGKFAGSSRVYANLKSETISESLTLLLNFSHEMVATVETLPDAVWLLTALSVSPVVVLAILALKFVVWAVLRLLGR